MQSGIVLWPDSIFASIHHQTYLSVSVVVTRLRTGQQPPNDHTCREIRYNTTSMSLCREFALWLVIYVKHSIHFIMKYQQFNNTDEDSKVQLRFWRLQSGTRTRKENTSADSKTKCVANSSPATHQTLWQQGGTGEDGHIHLEHVAVGGVSV